MCGGNPSAFCASRSVAHSDALFKTLRIHFFIQAFFIKKAFGKRNSLRAPALFILQPAIRYSLQLPHNPQKKCLRQSADKLAKAKIFSPPKRHRNHSKNCKVSQRIFGIPPFEGGGICRKAFYFARNDFLLRSIFYWRQREKSKTASFDFYFKLVVRIPVPRQVLGLCGSRKKRRIRAH